MKSTDRISARRLANGSFRRRPYGGGIDDKTVGSSSELRGFASKMAIEGIDYHPAVAEASLKV